MADYRSSIDEQNNKDFSFGNVMDQSNKLRQFLQAKSQFDQGQALKQQEFAQKTQLENKDQLAKFLQDGVKPDASGLNDFGQNKQDTAVATNKFTTAGQDPNSDRSKGVAAFLGKAPSGMGAPNVAAADAEKVQPVIDAAVKAVNAKQIFGVKRGETQNKDLQKDQAGLLKDDSYKQAQKGLDDGELAKGQLSLAVAGPDGRPANPIAGTAMPIVMAKLKTGTSRLNQQEIAAFGGSRALDARMKQAVQQAATGTLTSENVKMLSGIIDKDTEIHKQTLHQATLKHAMQRSQRTHSTVDQSYKELSGEDNSQAPTNAGPPPADPEFLRYQELLKKQQGQ